MPGGRGVWGWKGTQRMCQIGGGGRGGGIASARYPKTRNTKTHRDTLQDETCRYDNSWGETEKIFGKVFNWKVGIALFFHF